MNVFRTGWRNLRRNLRRTAITVSAVALYTAVLIASLALMEGMKRQAVRNATRLVVGDAQLHAKGYLAERSFYQSVDGAQALLAKAARFGYRAVPRSFGAGLLSCGAKSAGATFWGVDSEAERGAFELAQELADGAFLSPAGQREVVIGRKLAKSLAVGVGAELVAVVDGADGSLGNELFRVVGIFKSVSDEFDRGAVVMHQRDFEPLFASGGRVHEIALSTGGRPFAEVQGALGPVGALELQSWEALLPAVSDMTKMLDATLLIFFVIFFLAAGLGVLNTMLMATHDRVREYGVVKALGATPWRILREVAAEAFLLGLIATGLGLLLGLAVGLYTQTHGLDLSVFGSDSFGFSGIAWDPLWRGVLTADAAATAVCSMWGVCVLASLYPGIKAARLPAVSAMVHV
jgi:ABC-type lipoprotein release transport system permease subunit